MGRELWASVGSARLRPPGPAAPWPPACRTAPLASLSIWASPPHCLLSSPADTLHVEPNVPFPAGWVAKRMLSHRTIRPDARRPFCARGLVQRPEGVARAPYHAGGGLPRGPLLLPVTRPDGLLEDAKGGPWRPPPRAQEGSRPLAGSSRHCFREWPRVHLNRSDLMGFLPRAPSAEGKEASSAPSGPLRGFSHVGPPPAPTALVPTSSCPCRPAELQIVF